MKIRDILIVGSVTLALYDELLSKIKNHVDLVRVLANLQAASRDRHLPAFKVAVAIGGRLKSGAGWGQGDCGQGGGGAGRGRGGGGGGGWGGRGPAWLR